MLTSDPRGAKPHRNHGLFSDHYLDAALPGSGDWHALLGEAAAVMREVRDVFQRYVPKEGEKEARTESTQARRDRSAGVRKRGEVLGG